VAAESLREQRDDARAQRDEAAQALQRQRELTAAAVADLTTARTASDDARRELQDELTHARARGAALEAQVSQLAGALAGLSAAGLPDRAGSSS
jgi:septal ring factor EnvC (AmiA/AmiB activator)